MDLKPETPAVGIMKMGNHSMYKFMCSCGCEEHDVVMEFDEDEFGKTVSFYATTSTPYWRDRFGAAHEDRAVIKRIKQVANNIYNRVTIATQAIIYGYIKTESTTILTDQQAVTLACLLSNSRRESGKKDIDSTVT